MNDDGAEKALLGAMLVNPTRIGEVLDTVNADDFYRPTHSHIFAAIEKVWRNGDNPDVRSVAAAVHAQDIPLDDHLMPEIVAAAGSAWKSHADRVVMLSSARRILRTSVECSQRITAGEDPFVVLDDTMGELATIDMPGRRPDDLWSIDEFLDRPESERAPWVIPGLLRERWRALLVAPEGRGKSVVLRQCAIAVAQGIHPFTLSTIPPRRTLIVDLENPQEAISDLGQRLVDVSKMKVGDRYQRDQAWIWHREGGIDLRTRTDRGALEAVLADVKPHLVCIGPLYKMYRSKSTENAEQVAAEVQQTLDRLRARFGFALIMEHHAAKKQGGVRDLDPFGSSLWMRWPEFGLTAAPVKDSDPEILEIARFRGDRLVADWPTKLTRGTVWPWDATYPTGTLNSGRRPLPPEDDF